MIQLNYRVISYAEQSHLEEVVKGLMQEGWQTAGGLSVTTREGRDLSDPSQRTTFYTYHQAMVKPAAPHIYGDN